MAQGKGWRLTARQQKLLDKLLDEHCRVPDGAELAVYDHGWSDEDIRIAAEELNPDKDKPIAHASVVNRRAQTIGNLRHSTEEFVKRRPDTTAEIADLRTRVDLQDKTIAFQQNMIDDLRHQMETKNEKYINTVRTIGTRLDRLEAEAAAMRQLWQSRAYRHPDGRPIEPSDKDNTPH